MARFKNSQNYIFCIESEFNNSLIEDSSSLNMLEQIRNIYGLKDFQFINRKCATIEELTFYLKKISLKKYDKFSIIYFSLHGSENYIKLAKKGLTLDELSVQVPNCFQNKLVHFSSCETINLTEHELKKFSKKTNVLAVSGYTKEVNFLESVALEMLYFDWCQHEKDIKKIEKTINESYSGLVKRTGFKMYHRG